LGADFFYKPPTASGSSRWLSGRRRQYGMFRRQHAAQPDPAAALQHARIHAGAPLINQPISRHTQRHRSVATSQACSGACHRDHRQAVLVKFQRLDPEKLQATKMEFLKVEKEGIILHFLPPGRVHFIWY
jgi:hypothetical protein